jgi:hypothetical protein
MAIHDDDLRRKEGLPPRDPDPAMRYDPVERDPITSRPGDYRTQRPGGGFSWAWLLVPLVLILLVFAFWRPGQQPGDPLVAEHDPMARPEVGTTGDAVGLPITSPDEIVAAEAHEVAGRSVELQNVEVTHVSSDQAFWIDAGNGNGEQLLVVQDRTALGIGTAGMGQDRMGAGADADQDRTLPAPDADQEPTQPGIEADRDRTQPMTQTGMVTPEEGQAVTISGVIREVTDADRTAWGLAPADAERATEAGVYIDARHVSVAEAADEPATQY